MNRACFSYVVIDNQKGITAYIKTMPPMPCNKNDIVELYCCVECGKSRLVKYKDIEGHIERFSLQHIFFDIIKKDGCSCGQH